jgi:glycosyltransferase involved in cell wall biosynthesis
VHIGLNLVYLVPGETGGTEVVARELVPELVSARPDARFTAFINREAAERGGFWDGLVEREIVPVHASNRLQWVRGEQQLLPRLAARAGVDLVHSLANTAPLRGDFKRVVTIHDLIHRIHPEAHFGIRALGMRVLVTAAARRSHVVIADSESTKQDLVRLVRLSPDKVDVAPLGVGDVGRVPSTPETELRSRLGLGAEQVIVLTVSAKRPHKNLVRLVEALAQIPIGRRPLLVLPGYPTPYEKELRERAAQLEIEADVLLLDWVSETDLAGLYAIARCSVFPSLYEGFGLPVLEAMAHGVPVACSDRGSLKEVAESAALLFDPERPAEIAAAIDRLITDEGEAARLREAGRERAARFTWRATAEATVRAYDRALKFS